VPFGALAESLVRFRLDIAQHRLVAHPLMGRQALHFIDRQLRVAAMVDIVGYDESVDARRLDSMRRLALDTLPNAADYGQGVEWAGMRPATPTGVPIIGATAYRNLWLNVGHGALGFTLACGSGERLARILR
jgi:D-amino-acid dehydrogenase